MSKDTTKRYKKIQSCPGLNTKGNRNRKLDSTKEDEKGNWEMVWSGFTDSASEITGSSKATCQKLLQASCKALFSNHGIPTCSAWPVGPSLHTSTATLPAIFLPWSHLHAPSCLPHHKLVYIQMQRSPGKVLALVRKQLYANLTHLGV